jgi:phosphatidylglycerol:prolipoprotein diacylglycerol transferase
MFDPVCFRLGPISIHWYGVMMALGFFAGLATWFWLGRGTRRDFNFCADLLFWIMLSGIVGARVAYVIAEWGNFRKDWTAVIRVDQGGLIFYGGFIAAVAAVIVFARVRHQRLFALSDFVVTALPLAHAFGRVGCWMNGCCFGQRHDGPLAITYPSDSAPWLHQVYASEITRFTERSLPVHPVQLYEAAFNLALFALLLLMYRRRPRDGAVTGWYFVLYPAGRFALETLRGDERTLCLGVSVAQALSLGLIPAGLGFLAFAGRKQPDRSAPPA